VGTALNQQLQTLISSLQLLLKLLLIVFELEAVVLDCFKHLNRIEDSVVNALVDLEHSCSLLAHRVERLAALVGLVGEGEEDAFPVVEISHLRVPPAQHLMHPRAHEHTHADHERWTYDFFLEQCVI
jgi:hypothetical protein